MVTKEKSESKDAKKGAKAAGSSSKTTATASKDTKKTTTVKKPAAKKTTKKSTKCIADTWRKDFVNSDFAKNSEIFYQNSRRSVRRFVKNQDMSDATFGGVVFNALFSIFEFIGGSMSGSIAIMSDAVHDLGDAFSIGFAHYCKRKSNLPPDKNFTFGYARYTVLSAFMTSCITVIGSALMIYLSILRLFNPTGISYWWMICFSIIGLVVNTILAFRPARREWSPEIRVRNPYLVEDVIGWLVVLAGSILICATGWNWLDPIMSISIAIFLIGTSLESYHKTLDLFLEKVPSAAPVDTVRFHVMSIPHVKGVHHVHVWSMDDEELYATMHVVVDGTVIDGILLENSVESPENIKARIREHLKMLNIDHVTIELETDLEECTSKNERP